MKTKTPLFFAKSVTSHCTSKDDKDRLNGCRPSQSDLRALSTCGSAQVSIILK